MDLTHDLKAELIETINHKVKNYTLDQKLDVLKINHIEVVNQKEEGGTYWVNCTFDTSSKNQSNMVGNALANITINVVNIDGKDYQEYQIYFEEITVE